MEHPISLTNVHYDECHIVFTVPTEGDTGNIFYGLNRFPEIEFHVRYKDDHGSSHLLDRYGASQKIIAIKDREGVYGVILPWDAPDFRLIDSIDGEPEPDSRAYDALIHVKEHTCFMLFTNACRSIMNMVKGYSLCITEGEEETMVQINGTTYYDQSRISAHYDMTMATIRAIIQRLAKDVGKLVLDIPPELFELPELASIAGVSYTACNIKHIAKILQKTTPLSGVISNMGACMKNMERAIKFPYNELMREITSIVHDPVKNCTGIVKGRFEETMKEITKELGDTTLEWLGTMEDKSRFHKGHHNTSFKKEIHFMTGSL